MTDDVTNADQTALTDENRRLRGEVERLEARVAELDRIAHMDPLIPCANRRGLVRQLELQIARHQRHGVPSALLFVDVDGLKHLNDTFGHLAGDAALVYLAGLMAANVRQTDLVARIGGDEFVVLLDHADRDNARDTAARIVEAVAAAEFLHEGAALPLGVAIGMTQIERGDDPEAVLDRADQAMYLDKAAAA